MSQRLQLYADSDITVGGYTPTPLWDELDSGGDSQFITSPIHTIPITVEWGIDTGEGDPGVDTSITPWRYSVRMKKEAGTQTITAVISLMQGAVVKASRTGIGLGTAFVTYGDNLSDAEVASITDWTDLRIRLVTTGSIALPRRRAYVSGAYGLFPIKQDQTRIRNATIYSSTLK